MLASLVACLPALAAYVVAHPNPTPRPELKFLFHLNTTIGETILFGPGPRGSRLSVPITGGWFAGPKISGTVLDLGSEWGLTDAAGKFTANAYYQLQTNDGANIFVHAAGPGQPFSHVILETGSEKYYWLNDIMIISEITPGDGFILINAWELVSTSS